MANSARKTSIRYALTSLFILAVVAGGGWLFLTYGPTYLLGDHLRLVQWVFCALIAVAAVVILVDPLRLSIRGGYLADLLVTLTWGALIVYFFMGGGPTEVFGSWKRYWCWGFMVVVAVSVVMTVWRYFTYESRHARRLAERDAGETEIKAEISERERYQISARSPLHPHVREVSEAQANGVMRNMPDRTAGASKERRDYLSSRAIATAVTGVVEAAATPRDGGDMWDSWDRYSQPETARLARQAATQEDVVISPIALAHAFSDSQLRRYLAGSFVDGGWSVKTLPPREADDDPSLFIACKNETKALVACYGTGTPVTVSLLRLVDELGAMEGCNGAVVAALGTIEDGARAFAREACLTLWEADDLADFV